MKVIYKVLLIPFLICLAFNSFGQNDKFIGVKLKPSLATAYPEYGIEASRFAFSGGIQYIHKFNNPNFGIESGLYFMDRGTKVQWSIIDPSGVVISEDTILTRYLFLSLPVMMRVEFSNIYTSAGLALEYFFYGYEKSDETENINVIEEDDDTNLQKFNLGLHLAIGYSRNISERWNGFAEARVNPLLTGVDEEIPFHLINLELAVGINYKF